jgi:hypothetical protein
MAASSNRTALHRTRLQLEALEDRTVPAQLDLTTVGASSTVNGVVFQQATPNANLLADEFLRLAASNKQVTQGYNSNGSPQYDENDNRTRSIRMNDLTPITANGVTYRVIQLNTNERQGAALVSLDELRIYAAGNANLYGYNTNTERLDGRTAVWDLGDNWLRLNANHGGGADKADMLVYIPQSMLTAGGQTNPWVYVYCKFGVHNPNSGGNERWGPAVGVVPPPPPPPSSNNASISGFVFNDFNMNSFNDDTGAGIPEVTVILRGTSSDGDVVEMEVLTGQDGSYTFIGLEAGTYEILEAQPLGYTSGTNTVGTVDGVQNGMHDDEVGDRFFSIMLGAGKQGVNYNFAEFVEGGES